MNDVDDPPGYSTMLTVLAGDDGIVLKLEHWLNWIPPAAAVTMLDATMDKLAEIRAEVWADVPDDPEVVLLHGGKADD